jgi:hypothetical protein
MRIQAGPVMNRIATAILFVSIATAAPAQTAPQYRVLRGSTARNAASDWNAAADQGYRVLFEGRLAVMHLEASAPHTYRYAALPDRNLRDTFLNALNQQGAFGYRWVKGTRMLEKLPDPHVYEYEVVEGIATGTRRTSRDSLVSQGFAVVGRFGSVPVFMRDTTLDAPGANIPDNLRFADGPTPGKLLKQIGALAAQGYRYRFNEPADAGSHTVMQLCDSACGGPFEYRRFEVKNAPQVEKTLNDLASDGYRIVPGSLEWEPYLVERPAARPNRPACSYRVSAGKDADAVEQFLNTAARDGFVPVGFVVHIGWTADVFIVAEKTPASSPQ